MVRKIKNVFKKNNVDVEKLIEENSYFREELQNLLDRLENLEGEKSHYKFMAIELQKELEVFKLKKQPKTKEFKPVTPIISRKKLANQEKIKKVLEENQGISITDLSKIVKISRQSLYRYYRGVISAK